MRHGFNLSPLYEIQDGTQIDISSYISSKINFVILCIISASNRGNTHLKLNIQNFLPQ